MEGENKPTEEPQENVKTEEEGMICLYSLW